MFLLLANKYKHKYDRINEPPHDKTNKMTCAPSEDPVWSVFAMCFSGAKDPSFLHGDSDDSDQTRRMPRLIWVMAGRTGHFVGFAMRWLKCENDC